jgi:hypothetical protein
MLILADARLPLPALQRLESLGEVIAFNTSGITYPAISGHPDIFFCPTPKGLVHATNTPAGILETLKARNLPLIAGQMAVGAAYPFSAAYNAFANDRFLLHHPGITDGVLARQLSHLELLPVKQGYSRCNLVEAGGLYITGDCGIQKVLQQQGLDVFFTDCKDIILPGSPHGFIGGCTGVYRDVLYLCGSPDHLPNGRELVRELQHRGIRVEALYEGPLWDGGSILFLET